jgi:hypothetical protein
MAGVWKTQQKQSQTTPLTTTDSSLDPSHPSLAQPLAHSPEKQAAGPEDLSATSYKKLLQERDASTTPAFGKTSQKRSHTRRHDDEKECQDGSLQPAGVHSQALGIGSSAFKTPGARSPLLEGSRANLSEALSDVQSVASGVLSAARVLRNVIGALGELLEAVEEGDEHSEASESCDGSDVEDDEAHME